MASRLAVYLLTAVLVGCPLICLGERCASADTPRTAVCGCCHDRDSGSENGPADGSPTGDGDDDQDPNCLCHGAIVATRTRVADADPSGELDTPVEYGLAADVRRLSTPLDGTCSPCQVSSFDFGRDLCVLLGVFLL